MTLRDTSPTSFSAGSQARDLQISTVLSWVILLGGLLTIGVAAYMVFASYSPLPFWDEWSELHYFAAERHPPFLSWLWTQHNEHKNPDDKTALDGRSLHFSRPANVAADQHIFHTVAALVSAESVHVGAGRSAR